MSKSTVPWLAGAGVVGPILCVPIAVLAALTRPGYSMRRDNLSGLGIGPHGWLMDANLVLFGLLMLGLAAGLYQAFPETGSRIGAGLFAVWALGLIAEGVFPTDPAYARPQTLHSMIHDAAFVGLMAGLTSSCLVFARSFRIDPAWRPYAGYSRLTGGLVPALLLVFLALGDASTWKGLVERVLVAVMCVWVEVVALRLRRLSLGRSSSGRLFVDPPADASVQRA